MKRGWLALLLAAIVIATGAAEYILLNAGVKVCVDMLNEADALMEVNEIAQARELTSRLDNRFNSQAKVYDVFMFHSEVLEISRDLAALRRYAQTGETAEFMATSARVKRTLLSLVNSREPRLENVL